MVSPYSNDLGQFIDTERFPKKTGEELGAQTVGFGESVLSAGAFAAAAAPGLGLIPAGVRKNKRRMARREELKRLTEGLTSHPVESQLGDPYLLSQGYTQEDIAELKRQRDIHLRNMRVPRPERIRNAKYPGQFLETDELGNATYTPLDQGLQGTVNHRPEDNPYYKAIGPKIKPLADYYAKVRRDRAEAEKQGLDVSEFDKILDQDLARSLGSYRSAYERAADRNADYVYSMESPMVRSHVEFYEAVQEAKRLNLPFEEILFGSEAKELREGLLASLLVAIGKGEPITDIKTGEQLAEGKLGEAEYMGELFGTLGTVGMFSGMAADPFGTGRYKPSIPALILAPILLKGLKGGLSPYMARSFQKAVENNPTGIMAKTKLAYDAATRPVKRTVEVIGESIPQGLKDFNENLRPKRRVAGDIRKGADEIRKVADDPAALQELMSKPLPGEVITYKKREALANMAKWYIKGALLGIPEITAIPFVKFLTDGVRATPGGAAVLKDIERVISTDEGFSNRELLAKAREAAENIQDIEEFSAMVLAALGDEIKAREEFASPVETAGFVEKVGAEADQPTADIVVGSADYTEGPRQTIEKGPTQRRGQAVIPSWQDLQRARKKFAENPTEINAEDVRKAYERWKKSGGERPVLAPQTEEQQKINVGSTDKPVEIGVVDQSGFAERQAIARKEQMVAALNDALPDRPVEVASLQALVDASDGSNKELNAIVRNNLDSIADQENVFEARDQYAEIGMTGAQIQTVRRIERAFPQVLTRALTPETLVESIAPDGTVLADSPLYNRLTQREGAAGIGRQVSRPLRTEQVTPDKPLDPIPEKAMVADDADPTRQRMKYQDMDTDFIKQEISEAAKAEDQMIAKLEPEEQYNAKFRNQEPSEQRKQTANAWRSSTKLDESELQIFEENYGSKPFEKLRKAELIEIANQLDSVRFNALPKKQRKTNQQIRDFITENQGRGLRLVQENPNAGRLIRKYNSLIYRAEQAFRKGDAQEGQRVFQATNASTLPLELRRKIYEKLQPEGERSLFLKKNNEPYRSMGSHLKDYPFKNMIEEVEAAKQGRITTTSAAADRSQPVAAAVGAEALRVFNTYDQRLRDAAKEDPKNLPRKANQALEQARNELTELQDDFARYKKTGSIQSGDGQRSRGGYGRFVQQSFFGKKETDRQRAVELVRKQTDTDLIDTEPTAQKTFEESIKIVEAEVKALESKVAQTPGTQIYNKTQEVSAYAQTKSPEVGSRLSKETKKVLDELGPMDEKVPAEKLDAVEQSLDQRNLSPNEKYALRRNIEERREASSADNYIAESEAVVPVTRQEQRAVAEQVEFDFGRVDIVVNKPKPETSQAEFAQKQAEAAEKPLAPEPKPAPVPQAEPPAPVKPVTPTQAAPEPVRPAPPKPPAKPPRQETQAPPPTAPPPKGGAVGGAGTYQFRMFSKKFASAFTRFTNKLRSNNVLLSNEQLNAYIASLNSVFEKGRGLLGSTDVRNAVTQLLVEKIVKAMPDLYDGTKNAKARENLTLAIHSYLDNFKVPFTGIPRIIDWNDPGKQQVKRNSVLQTAAATNRMPGLIRIIGKPGEVLGEFSVDESLREVINGLDPDQTTAAIAESVAQVNRNVSGIATSNSLGRSISLDLDRRNVSASLDGAANTANLALAHLVERSAESLGLPNRVRNRDGEVVAVTPIDLVDGNEAKGVDAAMSMPEVFLDAVEQAGYRMSDEQKRAYVGDGPTVSPDSQVGKFLEDIKKYRKLSEKPDNVKTTILDDAIPEDIKKILDEESAELTNKSAEEFVESSTGFLSDVYIHPDWFDRMHDRIWYTQESQAFRESVPGWLFGRSKRGLTALSAKTNMGNTGSTLMNISFVTGETPIGVLQRIAKTGIAMILSEVDPKKFREKNPALSEGIKQAKEAKLIKTTFAENEVASLIQGGYTPSQILKLAEAIKKKAPKLALRLVSGVKKVVDGAENARIRLYGWEDSVPKTTEFLRHFVDFYNDIYSQKPGTEIALRSGDRSYVVITRTKDGFRQGSRELNPSTVSKMLRVAAKLETDFIIPDYSRVPRGIRNARMGLPPFRNRLLGSLSPLFLGLSPFLSFGYLMLDLPGKPGILSRTVFGGVSEPPIVIKNNKWRALNSARKFGQTMRKIALLQQAALQYTKNKDYYVDQVREALRHSLTLGPTPIALFQKGKEGYIKAYPAGSFDAIAASEGYWRTLHHALLAIGEMFPFSKSGKELERLEQGDLDNYSNEYLNRVSKFHRNFLKKGYEVKQRALLRRKMGKGLSSKDVLALGFITGSPLEEAYARFRSGEMYGQKVDSPYLRLMIDLSAGLLPLGKDGAQLLQTAYGFADPKGEASAFKNIIKGEERKQRKMFHLWSREEQLKFLVDNTLNAATNIYFRDLNPSTEQYVRRVGGKEKLKEPYWLQDFYKGFRTATVGPLEKRLEKITETGSEKEIEQLKETISILNRAVEAHKTKYKDMTRDMKTVIGGGRGIMPGYVGPRDPFSGRQQEKITPKSLKQRQKNLKEEAARIFRESQFAEENPRMFLEKQINKRRRGE